MKSSSRTIDLTNASWTFNEADHVGKPGGFGQVYRGSATDGRLVAVKLLRPDIGDAAQRELEFAKAFVGRPTQHVVTILDYGKDAISGQSCIVMTLAEKSLADHLSAVSSLTEDELADAMIQIARGLVEAGDWVHRDLKPGNVLWCERRWQVADFGIARIAQAATAPYTLKGALTPTYAAPEQWDNRRASHATDVYALGCLGAELLAGRPPFAGPSFDDYARQHRMEQPALGLSSPRLRGLLVRMLAKPEAGRPDLEEVIAELTALRARPSGSDPGGQRLLQASAAVAEQTAREQAARAEAEADAKARRELRAHALGTVTGIAETLFAEIREHAGGAVMNSTDPAAHRGYRSYVVSLGQGRLTMSVGHFSDIPPIVFQQSRWKDVVCGDFIVVETNRYTRSASLWYADLGDGRYKWFEVAYWSMYSDNREKQPCYLPPGRDAELAASNVLGNWNFAYPPRSIEGANVPVFCQRWMDFLAEASQGRLSPPGMLPEEQT